MSTITTFLDGKKTYITAIVTALLAGAQALGYDVPQWLYAVLGAFGIGALRSAMQKTQ